MAGPSINKRRLHKRQKSLCQELSVVSRRIFIFVFISIVLPAKQ